MLTAIRSSYFTKSIVLATIGLLSYASVASAQMQCSLSDQSATSIPVLGFPHYGGVTLDKTLEILNGFEDLQAAAYDPTVGEFVFLGSGTSVAVEEQIHVDDLVVAARAEGIRTRTAGALSKPRGEGPFS